MQYIVFIVWLIPLSNCFWDESIFLPVLLVVTFYCWVAFHGASQVVQWVKNPPALQETQADMGFIPKSRWCPGGGHGNPPQYSCLENSMDRRAWWATVHRLQRVRHDWSNWTCMQAQHSVDCWRKGDPFQGLRPGSNPWKWIVWEDTHADRARDFTGKGCLGGEQEGKGTQEDSATWLVVLRFMVMGLVSGLSLASHSDSRSFLVPHALLHQEGFQRGFCLVGHLASPFNLSGILLVSGSLLVLCSLPGSPVIKELMRMVTMVLGQGGVFQSVFFPNSVGIPLIYLSFH